MITGGTDADTDTGAKASLIEDGGSMELVRLPAWVVKFRWDDTDELAHFVCCRDLGWRKALCGYEATEDDVVLPAADSVIAQVFNLNERLVLSHLLVLDVTAVDFVNERVGIAR